MAETTERKPYTASVSQANKIADFAEQLSARGFNTDLVRKLTVECMRGGVLF
jgi:hypothetical protein